jgi:glycine cleavage system regulatory protein
MIDLVVTLIGRDRPGLVEAVAETIVAHGGNWLESRMIHLAGKFAGILRVEVPAERTQALGRALEGLAATGLKVITETGEEAPAREHPEPSGPAGERLMDVTLLGLDRPGLVKEISQLLADHQVNVEELVTDRFAAPMSGEMIFRAEARIKVPGRIDAARLRAAIEHLASDLAVEIRVEEGGGRSPAAGGRT